MGKAHFSPVLTYESKTLTEGVDYNWEVSHDSNDSEGTEPKDAGDYDILVTGTGKFTGSALKTFRIVPKAVKPAVSLSKDSYIYNGKVKTPGAAVKDGDTVLKKNKDYSVAYGSGRKNAGRYKVTVTLKGNYKGSKSVYFRINKAENPMKVKPAARTFIQNKLKKAKTFAIGISGAQGKVTYMLNPAAKNVKIKVSSKGKVTVPENCKKGTYKITVKAKGNRNYKAGTKTVTITVK